MPISPIKIDISPRTKEEDKTPPDPQHLIPIEPYDDSEQNRTYNNSSQSDDDITSSSYNSKSSSSQG